MVERQFGARAYGTYLEQNNRLQQLRSQVESQQIETQRKQSEVEDYFSRVQQSQTRRITNTRLQAVTQAGVTEKQNEYLASFNEYEKLQSEFETQQQKAQESYDSYLRQFEQDEFEQRQKDQRAEYDFANTVARGTYKQQSQTQTSGFGGYTHFEIPKGYTEIPLNYTPAPNFTPIPLNYTPANQIPASFQTPQGEIVEIQKPSIQIQIPKIQEKIAEPYSFTKFNLKILDFAFNVPKEFATAASPYSVSTGEFLYSNPFSSTVRQAGRQAINFIPEQFRDKPVYQFGRGVKNAGVALVKDPLYLVPYLGEAYFLGETQKVKGENIVQFGNLLIEKPFEGIGTLAGFYSAAKVTGRFGQIGKSVSSEVGYSFESFKLPKEYRAESRFLYDLARETEGLAPYRKELNLESLSDFAGKIKEQQQIFEIAKNRPNEPIGGSSALSRGMESNLNPAPHDIEFYLKSKSPQISTELAKLKPFQSYGKLLKPTTIRTTKGILTPFDFQAIEKGQIRTSTGNFADVSFVKPERIARRKAISGFEFGEGVVAYRYSKDIPHQVQFAADQIRRAEIKFENLDPIQKINLGRAKQRISFYESELKGRAEPTPNKLLKNPAFFKFEYFKGKETKITSFYREVKFSPKEIITKYPYKYIGSSKSNYTVVSSYKAPKTEYYPEQKTNYYPKTATITYPKTISYAKTSSSSYSKSNFNDYPKQNYEPNYSQNYPQGYNSYSTKEKTTTYKGNLKSNIPKGNDRKKPREFEKKKPQKEFGYDVLIKKNIRGKRQFLDLTPKSRSLPLRDAINYGENITDNAVERSFIVRRSKKKVGRLERDLPALDYKFRRTISKNPEKRRSQAIIEKTKFAIDSQGEVRGLKAAKIAAKYKKFVVAAFRR